MGHVGCHLTIHFSEDALAFSLLLSSNISKRQPVVEPISSTYPFLHTLLVKFLSSKDWFPRDWFLQNCWTFCSSALVFSFFSFYYLVTLYYAAWPHTLNHLIVSCRRTGVSTALLYPLHRFKDYECYTLLHFSQIVPSILLTVKTSNAVGETLCNNILLTKPKYN